MISYAAQPWSTAEVFDYLALVIAALMVTSFPVVYGFTADLRDRLAKAILFATSATAAAFVVTAILWPLAKAGWTPPAPYLHWITRTLYLGVGLGKVLLLAALLLERRAMPSRVIDKRPREEDSPRHERTL